MRTLTKYQPSYFFYLCAGVCDQNILPGHFRHRDMANHFRHPGLDKTSGDSVIYSFSFSFETILQGWYFFRKKEEKMYLLVLFYHFSLTYHKTVYWLTTFLTIFYDVLLTVMKMSYDENKLLWALKSAKKLTKRFSLNWWVDMHVTIEYSANAWHFWKVFLEKTDTFRLLEDYWKV